MKGSIIKDNNGQTSNQLLSGLILIVVGLIILIVSSIIGNTIGIFSGIALGAIGFFLRRFFYSRQHSLESKKREEEFERMRALQREEEQRREDEIWDFKDANGECDKLIIYKNFRLELFEKAKKVIFNGTLYSYDEILSCELTEKEKIETKSEIVGYKDEVTTTYTTKTSGKSLAGRAIVGGVIAGPVGALIGGATAKRTTIAENHVSSKPVTETKEYKSIIYRLLIKTTKNKSAQEFITNKKSEAEEVKEVFDSIIQHNTALL